MKKSSLYAYGIVASVLMLLFGRYYLKNNAVHPPDDQQAFGSVEDERARLERTGKIRPGNTTPQATIQPTTTPQNTTPQPTHTENTGFQAYNPQQNTTPHEQNTTPHYRINTCEGDVSNANFRASPGGNIIDVLPTGTEFTPQLIQDDWVMITSGSRSGWVHKCFVEGSVFN